MQTRTEIVPVEMTDGTRIHVEANVIGGEEEVGIDILPFQSISTQIQSIARDVLSSLKDIQPSKLSVQFGLSVALESGTLTTLLVKGKGTGNLAVTLEWEQK